MEMFILTASHMQTRGHLFLYTVRYMYLHCVCARVSKGVPTLASERYTQKNGSPGCLHPNRGDLLANRNESKQCHLAWHRIDQQTGPRMVSMPQRMKTVVPCFQAWNRFHTCWLHNTTSVPPSPPGTVLTHRHRRCPLPLPSGLGRVDSRSCAVSS